MDAPQPAVPAAGGTEGRAKEDDSRAPIRIALLGHGYWGSKLLRSLQASADFTPVSVYTPSGAQAEDLSPNASQVPFASSLEAVLSDPEIEALVIASPISTHFDLCRRALLADKHVLVEKPMFREPDQAQELASLARSRGLHLQTELTYTFSPSLLAAQAIVEDGWIGELRHVAARIHQLGRFREDDVVPLLTVHLLSIASMFVDLDDLDWRAIPTVGGPTGTTSMLVLGEGKGAPAALTILLDASLDAPVRDKGVHLIGNEGSISHHPLSDGPTILAVRYDRRPTEGNPGGASVQRERNFTEDDNLGRAVDAFARVVRGEERDNLELSLQIVELAHAFSTAAAGRIAGGVS